jgi:hypothetical protein
LGTLWNPNKIELIHSHSSSHWILTVLQHKDTDVQVSLFNIYAPVLHVEKRLCWNSIQEHLHLSHLENIIIAGDLNLTLKTGGKKRGSPLRDPFREIVDDLILDWDLEDIKPTKGLFTWSNRILGPGHIATRLDRFLVQHSVLLLSLTLDSSILPFSALDHKPILLSLSHDRNLGPIPFRFNPT